MGGTCSNVAAVCVGEHDLLPRAIFHSGKKKFAKESFLLSSLPLSTPSRILKCIVHTHHPERDLKLQLATGSFLLPKLSVSSLHSSSYYAQAKESRLRQLEEALDLYFEESERWERERQSALSDRLEGRRAAREFAAGREARRKRAALEHKHRVRTAR